VPHELGGAKTAGESETAGEPLGDSEKQLAGATHKGGTRGVQKRMDALARRVYEQQEELDALREAAARKDQKTDAAAGPRPKPTPKDMLADGTSMKYSTYEEYIEDLADWKAEQRLAQNRQAEVAQAEQERTQAIFDTYHSAVRAAKVKYEDFEEVVGQRLQIPQAAQLAIIEAGQHGPDIAYYLGQHPDLCAELCQLSPARVMARIGQIEGEVAGIRNQTSEARRTPVTRAPAPITPVGGSSSKSAVPIGELSYRDYKRIRDREEAENRRR
jgi:hypothetical protein